MNKITNEQLDSLIKSAVNSSGPLPPCEKFSQIISALRELRELRAAMLHGAEPAQEWIPCSERMPEQFKAILVFNEYGEVWSGAYDRYWNFYCDNELVECVTHWMPLPAAPQQESKP